VWQAGRELQMLWYYSPESLFFGKYQLEADDVHAQGVAVSLQDTPGNTYYRHALTFNRENLSIIIKSRRLAAPREDGYWVTWEKAPETVINLEKISDAITAEDKMQIEQWFAQNQPQNLLQEALQQAAAANRLINREK
jgi:hypothetical protein